MGECPADQKKPNAREAVDFKEVGVIAKVIASIDVADTLQHQGPPIPFAQDDS